MYPNDQFRQGGYERIPRFYTQNERHSVREIPGRSMSTQVPYIPREMQNRKSSNIPPMTKMDLDSQQKDLMLLSLPTDFAPEQDDPLKDIISLQNSIASNAFVTMKDYLLMTNKGAEIVNDSPHMSKISRNTEQASFEYEERERYVDQIRDGSAANLDDLL